MIRHHLNKALLGLCAAWVLCPSGASAKATIDYPIVQLRSLDKTTARTQVFEAHVGRTIKFGSVYIKVQACRKAPELEQPEAAAFLQVWEVPSGQEEGDEKAQWVFSGWMFSSSPGLSAMDHPIYDVWVLDCLSTEEEAAKTQDDSKETGEVKEGEGVLEEHETPQAPAPVDH